MGIIEIFGKIGGVVLGSRNERLLKSWQPRVQAINALEAKFEALSDAQLADLTHEFRRRYRRSRDQRREPKAILGDLLPEAFAAVREAAKRTLGLRPYDVQLLGGIVLHEGKIAEMKTGEGKTLVATLPAYLNALVEVNEQTGRHQGVHIVTVNDYLARRDADWMGRIYTLLGLTVGCIQSGMDSRERKPEYMANITYGTANEFGFDYLRDHMKVRLEDQVQQSLHYVIIDEVDSILIDEARTPLIISGPTEGATDKYAKADRVAATLNRFDQVTLAGNLALDCATDYDRNNDRYHVKNSFGFKSRELKIPKALIKKTTEKETPESEMTEEELEAGQAKTTTLGLYTEDGVEIVGRKLRDNAHEIVIAPFSANIPGPAVRGFVESDCGIEEDHNSAYLNEAGIEKAQQALGLDLYEGQNLEWPHMLQQALRARHLYKKDVQYLVREGQVIIVDEATGREMPGRRWSDGLHQAVEAKERLTVREETQTLGRVTIQDFFRLYDKRAGMTGTALTEAAEFDKIYKLDVVEVPTNRLVVREDHPDLMFGTKEDKLKALEATVKDLYQEGRPILLGTTSVESSEEIAQRLRKFGIPAKDLNVLNAKHHEREAEIVAEAGRASIVTIATNMAGRGTDIVLGGDVEKAIRARQELIAFLVEQAELLLKTGEQFHASGRDAAPGGRWKQMDAQDFEDGGRAVTRLLERAEHLFRLVNEGRPGLAPFERVVEEWPALKLRLAGWKEARGWPQVRARLEDLVGAAPDSALIRAEAMRQFEESGGTTVKDRGGLCVIGTERHESRRIDNQLKGRCGRQGDPGSTRFFLSLEDDIFRLFASDWIRNFMKRTSFPDGEPLESRMLTRVMEKTQERVESRNYESRKTLLEYDGVLDRQRKVIYRERQQVIEMIGLHEKTLGRLDRAIAVKVGKLYDQRLWESPNEEERAELEDKALQLLKWFEATFGRPALDALPQGAVVRTLTENRKKLVNEAPVALWEDIVAEVKRRLANKSAADALEELPRLAEWTERRCDGLFHPEVETLAALYAAPPEDGAARARPAALAEHLYVGIRRALRQVRSGRSGYRFTLFDLSGDPKRRRAARLLDALDDKPGHEIERELRADFQERGAASLIAKLDQDFAFVIDEPELQAEALPGVLAALRDAGLRARAQSEVIETLESQLDRFMARRGYKYPRFAEIAQFCRHSWGVADEETLPLTPERFVAWMRAVHDAPVSVEEARAACRRELERLVAAKLAAELKTRHEAPLADFVKKHRLDKPNARADAAREFKGLVESALALVVDLEELAREGAPRAFSRWFEQAGQTRAAALVERALVARDEDERAAGVSPAALASRLTLDADLAFSHHEIALAVSDGYGPFLAGRWRFPLLQALVERIAPALRDQMAREDAKTRVIAAWEGADRSHRAEIARGLFEIADLPDLSAVVSDEAAAEALLPAIEGALAKARERRAAHEARRAGRQRLAEGLSSEDVRQLMTDAVREMLALLDTVMEQRERARVRGFVARHVAQFTYAEDDLPRSAWRLDQLCDWLRATFGARRVPEEFSKNDDDPSFVDLDRAAITRDLVLGLEDDFRRCRIEHEVIEFLTENIDPYRPTGQGGVTGWDLAGLARAIEERFQVVVECDDLDGMGAHALIRQVAVRVGVAGLAARRREDFARDGRAAWRAGDHLREDAAAQPVTAAQFAAWHTREYGIAPDIDAQGDASTLPPAETLGEHLADFLDRFQSARALLRQAVQARRPAARKTAIEAETEAVLKPYDQEYGIPDAVTEAERESERHPAWQKGDLSPLLDWVRAQFALELPWHTLRRFRRERIAGELVRRVEQHLVTERAIEDERLRGAAHPPLAAAERYILLESIDEHWKAHLQKIDVLREHIRFEKFSQKDPKEAFKKEGYLLFEETLEEIDDDVARAIIRWDAGARDYQALSRRWQSGVARKDSVDLYQQMRRVVAKSGDGQDGSDERKGITVRRVGQKVRPNDPCPCGSTHPDGRPKKFKECCRG